MSLLSADNRKETERIWNIDQIVNEQLKLTEWHHKLTFTFVIHRTINLVSVAHWWFGSIQSVVVPNSILLPLIVGTSSTSSYNGATIGMTA